MIWLKMWWKIFLLGAALTMCGATGLSAPLADGPSMGWIIFVIILVVALVIAWVGLGAIRARQRKPGAPLPPSAEMPAPPAVAETPLVEAPIETRAEEPAAAAPPQIEAAPEPMETPPLVETMPEVEAPPVPLVPPAITPTVPVAPPFEPPLRPGPMPTVPQFLEAITLEGKLRRFPLDRARLTIGRALDNDIVIGDEFPGAASVANHHARVEIREAWVIVEPAGPNAPIFVNGQQTGRNILRNGWRLTLGDCDLVFRTAGIGTAPLTDFESESTPSAVPMPRPSVSEGFGPLPDGAVLTNNYIILESHSESPTYNTYVAESITPVVACGQCGFDANDARQKTCRNCGASLADSVPFYPHYRIKESAEEGAFSMERQLVGLSHPNALLPRQAFTEAPLGGAARYYIVEPEAPQLAASLRGPQEIPMVLEWTHHLAQGMAYLHSNGVSLGPIDLWRIAIEGTQAHWVDFSACEFVNEAQQPTRFAAEVRALAEVAYHLITGKRRYDESVEISPPGVGMLFDRILGGVSVPTAAEFAEELQAGLVEVRRPTSLDVRVGRLSDVGQLRQLNEDSLLTIEIGRVRRSISEPIGLYVVCDGMGGHAAGDVASGLAVQTLARKALAEVMSDGIADDAPPNWESWLKGALQEVNQAVFGRRRASGNDMGTTCVAAIVHGDMVTIAHAGDSRAYLVNEQNIQQLTQDHSLVQRLIQLGQLTPEEARVHPRRNVIYKNLGDKATVEPDIQTIKVAPGDRLLLCSDGLNTMISDERIRQIVMAACSPQEACQRLVEAANHAGGDDNISVIVVQIEALD